MMMKNTDIQAVASMRRAVMGDATEDTVDIANDYATEIAGALDIDADTPHQDTFLAILEVMVALFPHQGYAMCGAVRAAAVVQREKENSPTI